MSDWAELCDASTGGLSGRVIPTAGTNAFVIGLRSAEVKEQQKKAPDWPSGFTFQEWDPTENVDSSQMPVAMIINSSELRAAGFTLRKVFPSEPRRAIGLRTVQGYANLRV